MSATFCRDHPHLRLPRPFPSFFRPSTRDWSTLRQQLRKHERERLLGVGIAAPYGIGGWQEVDIPDTITEQWNTIDIKQRVQKNQPETAWAGQ
ncbi:MAG: hypothetical protein R3E89_07615 [Thiolinea sp.]